MENSMLNTARRYDIDWLRVLLFGLLIFYHVGMFFVPWGWHIKNNVIYDGLVYPMLFLNQWRLSFLFLISGMGTYFALSKRTGGQFAKERLTRLLLPLLFGMLVVVPPQVYIERLDKGQFSGNYFTFWFSEAFVGVYPVGNISWHHLWFIVYLLVFSLLFIPLFLYLRQNPQNIFIQKIRNLVASPYKIYLFVLPLYVWESLVEPFFDSTHALLDDWFNLINYSTFFLYGFLLITVRETFWQTILTHKNKFLVVGIVNFSIFITIKILIENGLEDGYVVHFSEAVFKVLNCWSWILTFLGFAATYLNHNSPTLQYANEAVYPFYILHQTLIIVLAYFLKNLAWSFALKFTLLAVGTFVLAWLLYELLIRRIKVLRLFFGLK